MNADNDLSSPTDGADSTAGGPSPTSSAGAAGPIVARPGRYYRNTRYLMFILVLGFGLACIYDGWVRWPRQNVELRQAEENLAIAQKNQDQAAIDRYSSVRNSLKHHTAMDLNIQKGLGIVLPPLAIILLIRAMYLSRGRFRLEENILHAPGHPPIPLDRVKQVDRRLWDRKGILYFDYELTDGSTGKVKLDDFVYDRKATDAIAEKLS